MLAIGGSVAMADPAGRTRPGARGVASSSAPSSAPSQAAFLHGCALLALSPAAWATSLFIQKPLLARYPPFTLTAWTFAVGTSAMGALAAALYAREPAAWRIGRAEALALAAATTIGWCAAAQLRRRSRVRMLTQLRRSFAVCAVLAMSQRVQVLRRELAQRARGRHAAVHLRRARCAAAFRNAHCA